MTNLRLTKAMRNAIHHAWTDSEGNLRCDISVCGARTRKALERRGLVHEWSYALTSKGADLFAALSR
jgi:hypothetical protein